jgi:predicted tellurium resistance membrane protein TerC
MKLDHPLFTVRGNAFSGRDLVLIAGGLFLMGKATYEIHHKIEAASQPTAPRAFLSFWSAVIQIILIDLVFSVDSVITAVGMARQLWVMIAAVVLAILFMLAFVGPTTRLIDAHPSLKVLALAFLLLVGFNLLGEGFGYEIPKGYTYFAMAFALGVEVLNIRIGTRQPTHRQ